MELLAWPAGGTSTSRQKAIDRPGAIGPPCAPTCVRHRPQPTTLLLDPLCPPFLALSRERQGRDRRRAIRHPIYPSTETAVVSSIWDWASVPSNFVPKPSSLILGAFSPVYVLETPVGCPPPCRFPIRRYMLQQCVLSSRGR